MCYFMTLARTMHMHQGTRGWAYPVNDISHTCYSLSLTHTLLTRSL